MENIKEKLVALVAFLIILLVVSGFILLKQEFYYKKTEGLKPLIISEIDRSYLLNKITLKTIDGEIIYIKTSKYHKGYDVKVGDKLFLIENRVVINNDSYKKYSPFF